MNKSVKAQAWYLSNLLLLPGLSFLVLAWMYRNLVWAPTRNIKTKIKDMIDIGSDIGNGESLNLKQRRAIESTFSQKELDQSHARAAFWLSIFGGTSVFGGSSLIYISLENLDQALPLIIVYCIVLHTSFVLWGMVNLAQAMSSRLPFFKLF